MRKRGAGQIGEEQGGKERSGEIQRREGWGTEEQERVERVRRGAGSREEEQGGEERRKGVGREGNKLSG